MNHCINLEVQVFLKTCKVLKDVEGVEDEDLAPLEEDDEEPTEEEEEERRAATRVWGNASFRKDVEAAAEGFQSTMWKLRETAKVYPSWCNTQTTCNPCQDMLFVCYKTTKPRTFN